VSANTYRFHVEQSFQRNFFEACEEGRLCVPSWVADWVFSLDGTVDAPSSIHPHSQPGFIRPPRHRRCVYFSPDAQFEWVDGPVICIKGLEPAYPDFPSQLDILVREGPNQSGMSLFEHFPIVESKAPLALTRPEAYTEARSAHLIQLRFREAGLPTPRIPTPIAILRHSDEVADRYAKVIEAREPPAVVERTLRLIDKGIYCYIYYYPGPCCRLADLSEASGSRGGWPSETISRKELIDRWVQLFASLVSLGIIPATRIDRFTGSCFDANNAVLDGGVVDVGSCLNSRDLTADRDLYESLQISRTVLARTIVQLRLGSNLNFRVAEYGEQLTSRLIDIAVSERILRFGVIDDRVRKFFHLTPTSFEELIGNDPADTVIPHGGGN
jgi:hypothetical protein